MEAIGVIEANPYQVGGRLRDLEQFTGRRREIREVLSRVATMQSVSIYGERGVGKSSLLFFLTRNGKKLLGDTYSKHEFFYLDLQEPIETPEKFFAQTCRLLYRPTTLTGNGHTHSTYTKDDLENLIADRQIVLCLDEFEQAVEADFGSDFFKALRHLAQSGNLALVVATKIPLGELYRHDEEMTSGFSNVFQKVHLGELEESEARQLVETPRNGHRFTEDECDFILELGKNYPYRLNLACSLVYDARQRGFIAGEKIVKSLRDSLRSEFNAKLAATTSVQIGASDGSNAKPLNGSTEKEQAVAAATDETISASSSGPATRAQRAIRISVALSLVAGIMMFFATKDPNPISLILSGGVLLVSLGFLIATRILWPKETRRGEQ